MAVFRQLEAASDVVALHTYDSDIKGVLSQIIFSSQDYGNVTFEFVKHYARYSHDVLHKPLEFGEFDATTWANYWLRLEYSPNPYIKWFLQDVVRYHVDDSLIWPFEDGSDFYHVSPQETPEVFGWLRYYNNLLASTNNQTSVTTSSATSTTSTTTAPVPEFPLSPILAFSAALLAVAVVLAKARRRYVRGIHS